jgi:hypothetical protein
MKLEEEINKEISRYLGWPEKEWNFCIDILAVRAAIFNLDSSLRETFCEHLCEIVGLNPNDRMMFAYKLITATPKQLAEALVRTIL